jgi:hypothetical protein
VGVVAPSYEGYSGYNFKFEQVGETKLVEVDSLFKTELEKELEEQRVARVSLPLSSNDFALLSDYYATCVEEHPDLLAETFHMVDSRFGNEAGHVRKERKLHATTGKQLQDPKNLFHFNEQASVRWAQQFAHAPTDFREFLEIGRETQESMSKVGRFAISQLEETHPGITNAFYPLHSLSVSFMRVVRYDSYTYDDTMSNLPVAKPHRDIGAFSLHGYADAPGFWVQTPEGRQYFNDEEGYAHIFAGASHEKIYGRDSRIKAAVHGADRIAPDPGSLVVPERTVVVQFIDPWKIDCKVRPVDAGSGSY